MATLATVGRWTLAVLVLCLALIGFLHLTRGTAVHHVRGVAADGVSIGVSEPEFPLMATMATGAWLAPGNRVEVMLNGDGTYPRLWEDLRSAQLSITLQLYYGAPGRMADTLERDPARACQGGRTCVRSLRRLRHGGYSAESSRRVEGRRNLVEPFRPIRLSTLHLAQHRSHVRGVVIDSRVGWTGGFGIDDKWFGDGRSNGSWRDTNVRFEGPAVRQLQAAFAAAWVEATGVMFTGRATLEAEPNGATAAGLLYTRTNAGKHCRGALLRAVYRRGAQDAVYHELRTSRPIATSSNCSRPPHTWRRCADPDGRPAHRRQHRATRRTSMVRHAARCRRARVRMATHHPARQDVRRRWRVVHRRIDELRQSLDGAQR